MNNIKKVILYFGVLTLLMFVTACNSSGYSREDVCKVDTLVESTLPKLVIVGTDVVNIESFQSSNNMLVKSYSAEMGGAILTLSVISDSKGTHIERLFQEPGESIHKIVYKSVCIYHDTIIAENFIGKMVSSGVLILEKKPNIDGIPVDLWFFL
jgi:hypothetical protein